MDQNSNSVQHDIGVHTSTSDGTSLELPVSSQNNESDRETLSLSIGDTGPGIGRPTSSRGLISRTQHSTGDHSFLSMELGDDSSVQIRSLAGGSQDDSLVLTTDHIHPFSEVDRLPVNNTSVAETNSPVASGLQSTHGTIGLRSLSTLDYAGSLDVGDQDSRTHRQNVSSLHLSQGPQRKRHHPQSDSEPSSPDHEGYEPNITSQLLAESILQGGDLTSRLATSGPIGMAAAAAISSNRKKKKPYSFESNPALRKRHKTKLLKRLKDTLDEFTTRVGLQACVVVYQPGKAGAEFNIYGADPLSMVIQKHKNEIISEVDSTLTQGMSIPPEPVDQHVNLFELPPLIFDGIPTPVSKMTQSQLRTFIPLMLKYSQNRGKPGWGKENHKPIWWPENLPWENIRSDPRPPEERITPWTDAMRQIVLSCYAYHGRIDLLPEVNADQNTEEENSEMTRQLQEQMTEVERQQDGLGQDSHLAISTAENSQVYVDTGEGGDDEDSGLATLSDSTLAETAARLQQAADETGQVQYATQTVTVCEKDAKALGQPAGTTTTVLLTAYPGGHRIPDDSNVQDLLHQQETEEVNDQDGAQSRTNSTSVIIDTNSVFPVQSDRQDTADNLQTVDQYLNKTSSDVCLSQPLSQADIALVSQYMTAAKSNQ